MSRALRKSPRLLVGLLALLVAIGVGGTIAFRSLWNRDAPESPEQLVSKKWESARKTPMHRAHVGKKKIACSECHGPNGEGLGDLVPSTPSASSASPAVMAAVDAGALSAALTSCSKCHEKQSKTSHRANVTTCTDCHAFRGDARSESCSDCHAASPASAGNPRSSKKVVHHHAQRDLSCTTCHDVHDDKQTKMPGDCRTSGCHDALAAAKVVHGKIADVSKEGCASCHTPHAGKESARTTCAPCHTSTTPAGGAATIQVASWLTASPLKKESAPRITHTPSPHDSEAKGRAGSCLTCHATAHDVKRSSVRGCDEAGCHANKKDGHQGACTSCHSPHALPRESARTSCTKGCHTGVTVLGADKFAQHKDCRSCHDPHRPAARAADACTLACHANVAATKKHPPDVKGGKGACVGCHAPHPPHGSGQQQLRATACSSCHTKAKNETGFHAVGRTTCAQCHKPHAFAIASMIATQACGTQCHQEKAAAAAKATNHTSSKKGGHLDCAACHGKDSAHAPIAKPDPASTCPTCHAAEAKTLHRGHGACASCHDVHSGERLPRAATCTASCHANKATASTLHANVILQGGKPIKSSAPQAFASSCATCHRAHDHAGASHSPDPACASCHASASLPGLHKTGAHTQNAKGCATCHTAHGPPRADRSTCTTSGCHSDRTNHQPEATTCKGCHFFRK